MLHLDFYIINLPTPHTHTHTPRTVESYLRRSAPWSLSLKQCCQIWTRSSCCCTGTWWPRGPRCHSISHAASSQRRGHSAPPRSRTYTPEGTSQSHLKSAARTRMYSLTVFLSPHFPPAQRPQTAWRCDTVWGRPAATRSSCWADTPWASRECWWCRLAWKGGHRTLLQIQGGLRCMTNAECAGKTPLNSKNVHVLDLA